MLATPMSFLSVQGYSLVCSFGAASLASAPYRVENNCSRYCIAFRQKENSGDGPRSKGYFCLLPGHPPQPFAWDELVLTHRLAVVVLPIGAHIHSGSLRCLSAGSYQAGRAASAVVSLR